MIQDKVVALEDHENKKTGEIQRFCQHNKGGAVVQ